jgi:hypothetical protein
MLKAKRVSDNADVVATEVARGPEYRCPECNLAAIMRQPKAPAAARVQACIALLDRGWGKPKQTVGGDLENPLAVRVTAIEHTIVHPKRETENR